MSSEFPSLSDWQEHVSRVVRTVGEAYGVDWDTPDIYDHVTVLRAHGVQFPEDNIQPSTFCATTKGNVMIEPTIDDLKGELEAAREVSDRIKDRFYKLEALLVEALRDFRDDVDDVTDYPVLCNFVRTLEEDHGFDPIWRKTFRIDVSGSVTFTVLVDANDEDHARDKVEMAFGDVTLEEAANDSIAEIDGLVDTIYCANASVDIDVMEE